MLKISVVIVTYNAKEYIKECLESLKKQTLKPLEVIVVDNNSSDNTIDIIKRDFPEVSLIENKDNKYFAPGNNQGIELALKSNPDYVFLLNQDTVCEPDCLERLAQKAREKNLVLAQSLLMYHPETHLVQTAGNNLHFLGFGYSSGYKVAKEKFDFKKDKLLHPAYLSGAALLIKSSFLREYGGLDSKMFMYHEDTDISLRARILDILPRLVPESIVYHKYTENISNFRWFWSERNRFVILLKFYKLPTLILILPALLFMELGIIFYSIVSGWFFTKIKSYISWISILPHILKERKEIQKMRKTPDKKLAKLLTKKFDFEGFTHPLIKYIVNPILGVYWGLVSKIIFW